MSLPLISILIPAYNHEKFIEDAINSIWSQAYPNIEIIIVDDGSEDKTLTLAKAMKAKSPIPMKVVTQENRGINRTLNRALGLASGELIAIVASDDKFTPHRFESQVAMFMGNPDLKIVYGNGAVWNRNEIGKEVHDAAVKGLLRRSPKEILQHLYTNISPLFIQTCLVRKSFLELIGGFDERVISDDWVLNILIFQNLMERSEFGFVDEILFLYRQHDCNSHKDFDTHARRILEVVERYTPKEYRSSSLAKFHYDLAIRAASSKRIVKAIEHLKAGQQAQFNPSKLIIFIFKSIVYPVKRALRKAKQ